MAACKDGKSAAAYGLAHILVALSVTNKVSRPHLHCLPPLSPPLLATHPSPSFLSPWLEQEVQERALAEKEMDITADQLAELQRITKQRSEEDEEEDTAERVALRIREVVRHDGIRALVRLAAGASPQTRELVALALRQMAVEGMVRGSM
ncbi:MAG: hypothetical protein AAFU61_18500, partial [Pseudomonadota bacterium]